MNKCPYGKCRGFGWYPDVNTHEAIECECRKKEGDTTRKVVDPTLEQEFSSFTEEDVENRGLKLYVKEDDEDRAVKE